jgi:hypothetical protein
MQFILADDDPIFPLSLDFEDMSCEMFYGQMPPPIAEDPALQQPCFASMCMCSVSSSSRSVIDWTSFRSISYLDEHF